MTKRVPTNGLVTTPYGSTPTDQTLPNGQSASYWILNEEERAKGFVRPVRLSYLHETCGAVTTMSRPIAETYARKPTFYGRTFCVTCGDHFSVGADGEFLWDGTTEKVGT